MKLLARFFRRDVKEIQLRPQQKEIIEFIKASPARTLGIEAPTGTGKTIAYLSWIKENSVKTIISTFSKALQEQILEDARKLGMEVAVLKGKGNYICKDKLGALSPKERELLSSTSPRRTKVFEKVKVTSSYCRKEYDCPYRQECEYMKSLKRAKESQILVVNHHLLSYTMSLFHPQAVVIDECHHLEKALKQTIEVQEVEKPQEPNPNDYSSPREYNLALEKYYEALKEYKLYKQYGGGTFVIEKEIDFSDVEKVVLMSATFPPVITPEPEDFLKLKDTRDWSKVKIIVKDTNYKEKNYRRVLTSSINYALENYERTMILTTNYQTLGEIKGRFPHVLTTSEYHSKELAKMLENMEVQAIAGTDTLWTGVSVKGRKCIVITKLPFPNPNAEEFSVLSKDERNLLMRKEMILKLKQGIGRLLRSPQCEGEVILLDNRLYPEVVELLEELRKLGAQVEIEKKKKKTTAKVVKMAS